MTIFKLWPLNFDPLYLYVDLILSLQILKYDIIKIICVSRGKSESFLFL